MGGCITTCPSICAGITRHRVSLVKTKKWFLLQQFVDEDAAIAVDHSAKPEFDQWCWVSYYYPISQIIDFKREVYRQAGGSGTASARVD